MFGSVVRGEADEASDLDILGSFEPGRSLLDLVRLQLDLQDLLGVKVDVVEEGALHRLIREDVLHEAVRV